MKTTNLISKTKDAKVNKSVREALTWNKEMQLQLKLLSLLKLKVKGNSSEKKPKTRLLNNNSLLAQFPYGKTK